MEVAHFSDVFAIVDILEPILLDEALVRQVQSLLTFVEECLVYLVVFVVDLRLGVSVESEHVDAR